MEEDIFTLWPELLPEMQAIIFSQHLERATAGRMPARGVPMRETFTWQTIMGEISRAFYDMQDAPMPRRVNFGYSINVQGGIFYYVLDEPTTTPFPLRSINNRFFYDKWREWCHLVLEIPLRWLMRDLLKLASVCRQWASFIDWRALYAHVADLCAHDMVFNFRLPAPALAYQTQALLPQSFYRLALVRGWGREKMRRRVPLHKKAKDDPVTRYLAEYYAAVAHCKALIAKAEFARNGPRRSSRPPPKKMTRYGSE